MKIFGKTLGKDIPIIAEVGVNHEGDIDAAVKLIRLAKEAGADAAKLQTYTPGRYASVSDRARLDRVTQFALDEAAHIRLAEIGKEIDLPVFSTPLSEDVVPFLDSIFPVFKIASGDISFQPAIVAAARTGKPVILSTGLASTEDIDRAVGWVRDEVGAENLQERLVLLQCVSAYPTPMNEANIASIPFLKERYGLHVGYSNHVIGPEACYAAVACGACLIEVHFTDQKTGREFRDHELSMEPGDLSHLVHTVPLISAAIGTSDKAVQPSEAGNAPAVHKGVVAARDLLAGTVLQQDDLMFARPASEVPAHCVEELYGKSLSGDVLMGELIPASTLGEA